ncbi:MAG: translational GTPase TypA [Acholeplasmatales bacterium]|jgi:GTP-binding protein|nr:translational GTPase TypA [Acholeplasmatales bacterium]
MNIRNIAIIAHVDHGKTTLVNKLLEQSHTLNSHTVLNERAMDSNDIERERGITILAKNTAIIYNNYRINILDTPGHADFGGEVERIMHMVDGVLLLVDAFEGVMPQTRFVLKKALSANLKPVVIINKIDRPFVDIQKTTNEIYDLFIDLGASEEQLDFKIIYASGLQGLSSYTPNLENADGVIPILDTIIKEIPDPVYDRDSYLLFQPALIDYNDYVGRMGVGKILQGTIKVNQNLFCYRVDGSRITFRVQKIYQCTGLIKDEIEEAYAGDIVSIAGLSDIHVGETITDNSDATPLILLSVDEPTVEMTFATNSSPFAGTEGKNVTITKLEDRLVKETQKDVALKAVRIPATESFYVSGRGELHLSILIENMRREGFEFEVSRPKIIIKTINGIKHEPFEDVSVDVPVDYMGSVMEMFGGRGGELKTASQFSGFARLSYVMPSRGLIGFMTDFLTNTKGYGILSHVFLEYRPLFDVSMSRKQGSLISMNQGLTTAYALGHLEDRGEFFVEPRVSVYEGMIVGTSNRPVDLVVNVTQEKQLTNMRSSSKDQTVVLKKPRNMTLEASLSFIDDDELVEITPKSIRIRKKILNATSRKKDYLYGEN